MNVIHRQHLPPSGVEFSCQASLTPSTLPRYSELIRSSKTRPRPITNLIVARSTLLQVFELCLVEDDQAENNHTRNHHELKNKNYKLFHLCEHRLHGRVTGLQRLTTLDTQEDGLDRLLVSFQDAKMTLLEWSNSAADLVPISLHTFEKLPQITQGDLPRDFQGQLEVDPLSRCAVLLLPQATLAVLPFFQDQLDLDSLGLSGGLKSALGSEQQRFQTFPYASSFILDFNQQLLNHLPPSSLDSQHRPIKSVIALKFLPGFSEPTLAVLYQSQYTWSARLENHANTAALIVLTLDLGSNHFPIISHTTNLPYDAHGLVACPKELAGVLVLCADMILHVDQSSKIIGLATNGWVKHTSELQIPRQDTVRLITPTNKISGHRSTTNKSDERPEDLEDGEEQDESGVPEGHEKLLVRLENAKIVFSRADRAFVFLRTGEVFSLQFLRDGRTLTKLVLEKLDLLSIIPSTVLKVNNECLFVGSMAGDSALYILDHLRPRSSSDDDNDDGHQLPSSSIIQPDKAAKNQSSLDFDEDIYGDRTETDPVRRTDHSQLYDDRPSNGADDGRPGAGAHLAEPFLRLGDVIQAHGPIRDFTMAATGVENMPLELLACTGTGDLGGLTVFHREIPLRKRRKLSFESPSASHINALFFTSLVVESGGLSEERKVVWMGRSGPRTEIATYGESGELSLINTFPEKTLAVSPFFGKQFVVQVTNTAIKLFTSSLEEAQVIQPEPAVKILRASIVDDYVMLETHCGLKLIYQGDHDSKTLSKLPFPSDTDEIETASLLKAALPIYTFKHAANHQFFTKRKAGNEDDDLYNNGPTDANGDVEMNNNDANDQEPHKPQNPDVCGDACWLLTTTKNGCFHIRSLPTLAIVFTATRLDLLPETMAEEDKLEGDAQPVELFGLVDQAAPVEPIAHIFGFLTGAIASRPHLAVMLKNGALAVYEILCSFTIPLRLSEKDGHPAVLLKKVIGRQFEAVENVDEVSGVESEDHEMGRTTEIDEQISPQSRSFTSIQMDGKFKGVYLAGQPPVWLLSTDHGPCRIYDSPDEKTIHGIAQLPDGFLMSLSEASVQDEEPSQACDPASLWETYISEYVCLDREIPSTLVKTGRPFNKVFYDSASETVVGASYLETAFANFDEEGNLMWQPDDDSLIRATTFRSSLELILPGKWVTIDGYEFQQNEWVTSMANVELDSRSTVSGRRQFVGVGTTCNRAEDLAARGGIYVFEIVVVNPAQNHRTYNRALRLRYYEETKACVTAVDAINGYFLHTMGQKLYAKCFEQDERLLAVGFLDIKPYTTCMRIFKNFILLGDAVKGITLVAFQEEPYKLIELGHTYVDLKCSTIDFLVIDGKLAIVATDLNGVIRIFEYNPTNIESQGGQKLLCRSEFNTSSEMTCSMQFGKRLSAKDEAKVMGTFFASLDGSISSLVPAKEAVYKRLQLVQTRLTRHIQHFAGLNPKGHRTVRNDLVSRAINRGILDGELLIKFHLLSVTQQAEIAGLAGSDRETVLVNLLNLRGLW
ncbi:uncharacterized protein PGTG_11767 [Puccinia graminis f. sp. tritici CRL 75-36-700-3]|uniref:Protein CFT1 n=1 Tax=Puccinia graminis f. sp. tritici (strain CRL 75-36-700-3 / race SCCL) TaxID=418459 RepID=E3KM86_PUCGT|nr:uncharacterized protein PGTG_11767 [Puccinia graminis f. sp. tritici CRL 75-36-700-3]EFP85411.2 hypothetical protein PGTG_11767 [Puccinia graminis f. sp. tritici CRL 75-36-700-3]